MKIWFNDIDDKNMDAIITAQEGIIGLYWMAFEGVKEGTTNLVVEVKEDEEDLKTSITIKNGMYLIEFLNDKFQGLAEVPVNEVGMVQMV